MCSRMQANHVLHDDAPWIFVIYMDQVNAARATVKGFALGAGVVLFLHAGRAAAVTSSQTQVGPCAGGQFAG